MLHCLRPQLLQHVRCSMDAKLLTWNGSTLVNVEINIGRLVIPNNFDTEYVASTYSKYDFIEIEYFYAGDGEDIQKI